MRSVYTEKFQWAWNGIVNRERVERRGPLNISVSRKTACSGDISQLNLIVGWSELAKSTKKEIFSTGMFYKENM